MVPEYSRVAATQRLAENESDLQRQINVRESNMPARGHPNSPPTVAIAPAIHQRYVPRLRLDCSRLCRRLASAGRGECVAGPKPGFPLPKQAKSFAMPTD